MNTLATDWQTIASIMAFGAIGALLRYGTSMLPTVGGIAMGTITVNLLGSFVLGFGTALFVAQPIPLYLKTGITTGLLGSFTTFSTFSLENARLIQNQEFGPAAVNIVGQLVGGLTLALFGLYLGAKWYHD